MKPSPAVVRPLMSASVPRMSALNSARPPLLPRLTILKNKTPLLLERSAGRTMSTSVTYSTMPPALRGARLMSWMPALAGARGSTSPIGLAGQPFIGAGRAEARPGKGRLGLGDLDPRDARFGGPGGEHRRRRNGSKLRQVAHICPSLIFGRLFTVHGRWAHDRRLSASLQDRRNMRLYGSPRKRPGPPACVRIDRSSGRIHLDMQHMGGSHDETGIVFGRGGDRPLRARRLADVSQRATGRAGREHRSHRYRRRGARDRMGRKPACGSSPKPPTFRPR